MAKKQTTRKKKPQKKNVGGRPTKYKVEFNDQAEKLCLLGATDDELADFFGVEQKTINNWKKKYPKFLQSIKRGKDEADIKVVESLLKRALGYKFKEEKIVTEKGRINISEIEKEMPPDVTAIIFWLKNRQPTRWRDQKHNFVETDKKQVFMIGGTEIEF